MPGITRLSGVKRTQPEPTSDDDMSEQEEEPPIPTDTEEVPPVTHVEIDDVDDLAYPADMRKALADNEEDVVRKFEMKAKFDAPRDASAPPIHGGKFLT